MGRKPERERDRKRTRYREIETEKEASLVCSEMGEFIARIRINLKLLNRKNGILFVKWHARKFAYWVGTSTRRLVNSTFAINMNNNARYICWTMCSFCFSWLERITHFTGFKWSALHSIQCTRRVDAMAGASESFVCSAISISNSFSCRCIRLSLISAHSYANANDFEIYSIPFWVLKVHICEIMTIGRLHPPPSASSETFFWCSFSIAQIKLLKCSLEWAGQS